MLLYDEVNWTAFISIGLLLVSGVGRAQDAQPPENERWNLFYQATSIGQYHGTFSSPYAGPLSLQDHSERVVSLTTTLFLGLRLSPSTQLYFDPEIAGGK